MPISLKLSRREGSAFWWITGTVDGRRIRKSTGRTDRRQAEVVLAQETEAQHRASVFGPEAVVTWGEAMASYLEVNEASPGTLALLERLNRAFDKKLLKDIGQSAVDQAIRILCKPDASPATKQRNVLVPLKAVLNHAARRGWCKPPAFETPKGAGGIKRTRWLTPAEYDALRSAMPDHLRPLAVFLVCTGARLGEALSLDWSDVDLERGTALLRETKNGRDRLAALPPAAVATLSAMTYRRALPLEPGERRPRHEQVAEREGSVFRTDHGVAYADRVHGGGQVKSAWRSARLRAGLGADVTPHILRHTWATWHYALHRDLMKLRDDGDWSSVTLVERYAKLPHDGMAGAVRKAWGMQGLASRRRA
jgi:integrase